MQFSDTGASKNGLIQHCESLLDLVDGTISGDATLLATFTRYINVWYHRMAMRLWKTSGTWEYDDTNNTDFPIATTNLVANQRDYALPTNAVKIYRVEFLDAGGNWRKLEYMNEARFEGLYGALQNEAAGMPREYYLYGDSLWIYPRADATAVTLSNGLRLYLAREVTEFTTADTTKEPGFPKMYHTVPALGAAYTHANIKGMAQKVFLERELKEFLPEIEEFEEDKNRDERVVLQPRYVNYR